MSEPVKHVEIEDVLSSIRRLVSDDHRKPAPSTAEEDTPRAPERFVLTDALRVPDPADESPLVLDAPDTVVEPEDAGAVVDADVARPDEQAADEDQASDPVQQLIHAEARAAEHDDHGEQHADDGEDLPAQDGPEDPQDDTPQDQSTPALVEPEGDHTADARRDDDRPQLDTPPEQDDYADASPASAETDLGGAPWRDPDTTLYEAAGLSEPESADPPDTADDDIRPLGEKIAALEEVIGRTEDQWEPDGAVGDDYAGTDVETLAWEDTEADLVEDLQPGSDPVEEALRPEPEPMAATADPEPDAFADEDYREEALLDEAALRDLVADIVREELQGVLGERITRNVRKLVRREIQRALAVKDLE